MHHGQNRGKPKRQIKQKRNFPKIRKFTNFVEIGGICNMHHLLKGGMDSPGHCQLRQASDKRFYSNSAKG